MERLEQELAQEVFLAAVKFAEDKTNFLNGFVVGFTLDNSVDDLPPGRGDFVAGYFFGEDLAVFGTGVAFALLADENEAVR